MLRIVRMTALLALECSALVLPFEMALAGGRQETVSVVLIHTAPASENSESWPFVTGAPIARGALSDAKNARLVDARGKEIPAQFEPLAWWSPTRESVKWLRVAFSAPVMKGKTPEYRLVLEMVTTPYPSSKPTLASH